MSAIARSLILAFGLTLAALALRWLAPGVLHGGFAHSIGGHGAAGIAEFLGLGAIACAIGLPRQAVCFAGGLAFGAAAGTALALAATVIGCLADFLWVRFAARDWARRKLLARFPRLLAIDRFLAGNPFTAVLTLRLLPVGSSLLVSLAAGLSAAPAGAFILATALGALPQTLVFALLGSGVALGHVAQIVLSATLFVASGLLGAWLMRRHATGLATTAP
jgi:uncharacterized membrane protein YdjX (TVP38/TMEM64 family)